jgi:arylsulfatase A
MRFVSARLVLVLFGVGCVSVPAQKPPPNIVVFLADDLGWGDLGCYGHPKIKTPNLDAFAKQGMRLTQCYSACSVCSPSRSAILTGRTPYRNGVFTWLPGNTHVHLRKSEIAIATLLKKKGYATCHVGKWHLNGKFNSKEQPQPHDHGYDWWLGTQNNASPSHKNPRNFVRNGEPVGPTEGFSAVLVVDEAANWLRKHRDKSKPFFLSVWTHEPHLPIESDPRFMAHYPDADAGTKQHHGNVTQIDHAFSKLMKTLDELKLTEDTLVIFTSDNGPEGNGKRGRTRGSTGRLRGRKRAMYEGGIRVPGIIRWPGRVEKGSESSDPVIGSDIFTTICDVTDIPLPKDRTIDGASMVPLFAGGKIKRTIPMYWRWFGAPHGLHMAMRQGDWKILASEDQTRHELYNIVKDPQEATELSAKEPDLFTAMKATLRKLNAEIEAEGPDWWKSYGRRGSGRTKGGGRAGPLTKGWDKTGEFDVVKGCTVTKGDLGFRLVAKGEGFSLHKLDKPIRTKAVFRAKFRTLSPAKTRNAFLVFGARATNADLIKTGTAIGMGAHSVFKGAWNNVNRGKVTAAFAADAVFDVVTTVDFETRLVTTVIGGKTLKFDLPKGLEEIRFYGYYVKATRSTFSSIEIERD